MRSDPHARIRELLAARLDGPLTRGEWRELNGHLRKCAGCQQTDRQYRAQRESLQSLPPVYPPRDLWARTSAALDREVRQSYRSRRWSRRAALARRSAQRATGLVTVVAALGVVTALGVMQLAPAVGPANPSHAPVAGLPTPFAIIPQPFAFVGLGPSNIALYQTSVDQVCPTTAPLDCVPVGRISRTPVGLPADFRAGNIALSPSGRTLALVGRSDSSNMIAIVMMPGSGDAPSSQPPPTATIAATPSEPPPPTDTPLASVPPATPSASLAVQSPGTQGTPPPSSAPDTPRPAASARPAPSATPAATERPSPKPTAAPPSAPPPSAVPGLVVLSILDDVQAAGAPPAWSADGEVLAFSAMPADGEHGPDVYIWSPGEPHAKPITTDHASFFASWSGQRIVLSRASTDQSGRATPKTFVIDPQTLEERAVSGARVWLPVVNRPGTQAVAWSGDLVPSDGLPAPGDGALYLLDWDAVDPFGPSAANTDDISLTPLDPERDANSAPVVDWQARWSNNGEVLGVWVADSRGSSWGRLTVLGIDPATGRTNTDEPLLPATLARRGFTLGTNRVAWVAPSDANVDGELRIRTWGSDGVGGLRLLPPEEGEYLPAF